MVNEVPKEGKTEKIIGLIILVLVIVAVVVIKNIDTKKKSLITVTGAVGGGKENFLADEEFNEILKNKYGLVFKGDTWSNGKLVSVPVVNDKHQKYNLIFFSDERFYNYYKLPATGTEAKRDTVIDGSLTLNTPIVIYSWAEVVDALEKEAIVTKNNNVYYITDMDKLLNYILEGKKWSDIGLSIYGKINVNSTDPISSSPGATYYGLLLSIMTEGNLDDESIDKVLPKLKEFYIKSGYMNNTPADLFENFLKTGMGDKTMIVDYEKSIIDFANSNPDGWEQVKDKIRILYPVPTIWNSHCVATFDDSGNQFLNALEDKDIQNIAFTKYGFRVGATGGNYDVSRINISGVPQNITNVASSIKMDTYNKFINYLKGEGA